MDKRQLDDLALDILETMNEILILQSDVESRMRAGWLSLSRARVLMGHSFASVAQFDNRESDANVTVSVELDKCVKDAACVQFDVHQSTSHPSEAKRRFGALSPAAATDCEQRFNEATQLIAQLATTRAKLSHQCNLYEQERKAKLVPGNLADREE